MNSGRNRNGDNDSPLDGISIEFKEQTDQSDFEKDSVNSLIYEPLDEDLQLLSTLYSAPVKTPDEYKEAPAANSTLVGARPKTSDSQKERDYANALKKYALVFSLNPEENDTPKGAYYKTLGKLLNDLLYLCYYDVSGQHVWYRQAEDYYNKTVAARQEYEKTHLEKPAADSTQALPYTRSRTGQAQILTQLSNSDGIRKRDYANILKKYVEVFSSLDPDESDTPKGTYYEALGRLLLNLLNLCHYNSSGRRVWYRQAEDYYNKTIAAMQEYEKTHFKGVFTWVGFIVDNGMHHYTYTLAHKGTPLSVSIFFEMRAPLCANERFLLAEALRQNQFFLNTRWSLSKSKKEILIKSLYEDAILNDHEDAMKTTVLHLNISPTNKVNLWVRDRPSSSTDFYRLAMDIMIMNESKINGKNFVGPTYWLMNQVSIEPTLSYLFRKAAEKGHRGAKQCLEEIRLEKQQNKENLIEQEPTELAPKMINTPQSGLDS